MQPNVITMDQICKDYTLVSGESVPVLKSLDIKIAQGEFVSIMGPSGSGKSTLLNLLGTLDRPTSGTYKLDGEDISVCDDSELAHIRNRKIGFIFQGFNLLERRSILENIALPLFYSGSSHVESLRRAEHYLSQVGLSSSRNYLPNQLSGGQQQRIAIARALAVEPRLLLADEPTGNLDSQTGKDIMNLLKELNNAGITIILITHDQNIAEYGKRLIRIKDGQIVYDGPITDRHPE